MTPACLDDAWLRSAKPRKNIICFIDVDDATTRHPAKPTTAAPVRAAHRRCNVIPIETDAAHLYVPPPISSHSNGSGNTGAPRPMNARKLQERCRNKRHYTVLCNWSCSSARLDFGSCSSSRTPENQRAAYMKDTDLDSHAFPFMRMH